MATNFNNGKSLNECISDVMTAKSTKASKRRELIKLGLCEHEITMMLGAIVVERKERSKFDFRSLTFGVEIECYNITRDSLINYANAKGLQIQSEGYNHRDNNRYYKIVSDDSIQGSGANEIVSPVLNGGSVKNSLKKICDALAECQARVNRSCGLHVHIGAAMMSDEHYCRIVRNYQKLELAIDSFMPSSRRASNNGYCRSLTGLNFRNCSTKRDIREILDSRYFKVNAKAYERHQTIEFRQHSGSTDYEKIMHWVVFLAKLVEYSYKNECRECWRIEEIPFLTESEKQYFIERRETLRTATI